MIFPETFFTSEKSGLHRILVTPAWGRLKGVSYCEES